MNIAKRALMFVGFVVLVAAVLSVLAPKATHALVATLVQVANTPANPVPNKDVDSPGHATVVPLNCQAFANGAIYEPGVMLCTLASGGSSYTVPAGQRLVVEEVSVFCQSQAKDNMQVAFFNLTEQGTLVAVPLAVVPVPGWANNYSFTQSVRYYADPGTTLSLKASGNDTDAFCSFSANGYLVSYP